MPHIPGHKSTEDLIRELEEGGQPSPSSRTQELIQGSGAQPTGNRTQELIRGISAPTIERPRVEQPVVQQPTVPQPAPLASNVLADFLPDLSLSGLRRTFAPTDEERLARAVEVDRQIAQFTGGAVSEFAVPAVQAQPALQQQFEQGLFTGDIGQVIGALSESPGLIADVPGVDVLGVSGGGVRRAGLSFSDLLQGRETPSRLLPIIPSAPIVPTISRNIATIPLSAAAPPPATIQPGIGNVSPNVSFITPEGNMRFDLLSDINQPAPPQGPLEGFRSGLGDVDIGMPGQQNITVSSQGTFPLGDSPPRDPSILSNISDDALMRGERLAVENRIQGLPVIPREIPVTSNPVPASLRGLPVQRSPIRTSASAVAGPADISPPAAAVEAANPPPLSPSPPIAEATEGFTPASSDLVDDLLRAHMDRPEARDALRAIAEKMDDIPGVRHIVRLLNPSGVARNNPALRESVGYRLLEQVQDAQISQQVAEFSASSPFRNLDNQGRFALPEGRQIPFGDMAENPSQFSLGEGQKQWISRAWRYIDDLADNYEQASGRSIREELNREHYWPRFVRDEENHIRITSRVGSRQSPAKQRLFESMEDGLERGVNYSQDPVQQLQLYAKALNKMTRDAILENRLIDSGLARRLQEGAVPKSGEMATDIFSGRGFQTLVFDKDTAQTLRGTLNSGNAFTSVASMVSGVPRLLVTGLMDTGQFLIQGLPLLAKSPAAFANAVGVSIRTMAQPRFYAQWLANSSAAQRAARYGVDSGMSSEFFEAAHILGRIPIVGEVPKAAQRGFDSFLGAGRIMMFDGFADAAKAAGGEDELYRVARMVDTMMGTPSTRGMGVGGTQRQIESAFGAFSPRYTRSIFGALGYMFGKGFAPRQVQKILGKMLMGGMATTAGVIEAKGKAQDKPQEEINQDIAVALNPQSGARFMSIKFGEAWFGIGGAYRSLLAFMGALSEKDNWDFDDWGEAATNNPVVRYLRSRTSPVSSTLFDFIQGEDFLGRPVGIGDFAEDPKRALDYVFQKLGPFPVQAFLETGGTVGMRFSGALAEAGGLRAIPIGFTDAANDVTKVTFTDSTYQELEPYEKDEIRESDRVQEVAGRRESTGYFKRKDEIEADYEKGLQTLIRMLQDGSIQSRDASSAFFNLRTTRRVSLDEAAEIFGVKFDNVLEADSTSDERALAAYYKAREDAVIDGIYLPDKFDATYAELWGDWTPANRGYVLRNTNTGKIPEELFPMLRRQSRKWFARYLTSVDQREKDRTRKIENGQRVDNLSP